MKVAKITRINKYLYNKDSKVFYNFAVEDNENYFASNILTHNCYVGRYNNDRVYVNENIDQILGSVDKWVANQPWEKVPNQVDEKYYCIDIGCSTDVPLMGKYYDWQKVFDFFNEHERAKSTFATKYPTRMREYKIDPQKNRVRVSLMPQVYSSVLEPNTDKIEDRLSSIKKLQQHFEVHINFSPIIYHDNWLQEYEKLFQQLKGVDFKSECIFLTYNEIQYKRNSEPVNELCWRPDIQENKNSEYADGNIRYKWQLKNQMTHQFKKLYQNYFPIESIRYIF
jgi:spore photoproduct lyase